MPTPSRAAIADLLGDFIAYRGLRPADSRLPGLAELAPPLGLPAVPPRKGDLAYAQIVIALLQSARELTSPGSTLRRLIVVGDTRMSDGGAFLTLRDASGWEGRGFIGAEKSGETAHTEQEGDLSFANRWALLYDWAEQLEQDGFMVDQETVVVLDVDKTLLGARGRNDGLIDRARLKALRESVAEILGDRYDPARFDNIYRTLNQTSFHQLTGDNQDYVGYLCTIVAADILPITTLEQATADGSRFGDILPVITQRGSDHHWESERIKRFHEQISAQVAIGNPTPFKSFRQREFTETALLLGNLPDDAPLEQRLREELLITREVWEVAQHWRERGALLFGLSDKPDEAALPTDGQSGTPLHRIPTHIA